MRVPLTAVLAALLLALSAALPVAAQDASGGDCAGDGASPALAVISVLPSADSDEGKHETYSRNPFIVFEFPCAAAAELTAVALDGTDVLDSVSRIGSRRLVLALRDLELGKHSVVYSVRDSVGNTAEGARFLFERLELPRYEISLYPGWNLISFPWDIYEPEIGSVIGPEMQADAVLGYSNGEWTVAVRTEGGWRGSLTELLPGYGYWVRTGVSEVLEAVLLPTSPTSVTPTSVRIGWNLVGIVDLEQHPVGSVGAVHEIDEYFQVLCYWKAYEYVVRLQEWKELLPRSTPPGTVENGKGYWLHGRRCYH